MLIKINRNRFNEALKANDISENEAALIMQIITEASSENDFPFSIGITNFRFSDFVYKSQNQGFSDRFIVDVIRSLEVYYFDR